MNSLKNWLKPLNYKLVRKRRWRARLGEKYYSLNKNGVVIGVQDCYDKHSNDCYWSGNYFKTRDLAKIALEKIKKIFIDCQHE